MSSIYFENRQIAGQQLAAQLQQYRGQPAIVIALSDGGVVAGQPIADSLQAHITALLLEPIALPGEPDTFLSVREDGNVTYNNMWSPSQLDEFEMEYRTYIEEAKRQHYSQLRQALGVNCIASSDLLHDKNIILVSDALKSTTPFDAAIDFLKPIHYPRLIVAVPVATGDVLDRLHQGADEVICLGQMNGVFDADHYYTDNKLPSHTDLVRDIESKLFPQNPAGAPAGG